MNINESELKRKIAHVLRHSTRTGLWGNPEVTDRGVPVAFDGDQPTAWITADEVERRVAEVKDEDRRTLMQARLGLGTYRHWTSGDRQAEINRLYDRNPDRSQLGKSPRPPRKATDDLSEEIAGVLQTKYTPSLTTPRYDYERVLYSRSIALPRDNLGQVTEVHQRVIRSNVEGLRRIVVHQTEHWNSSTTAAGEGMGSVDLRSIRSRPDEQNGIKGERVDLEISFPPLGPDDDPRELTWIRTRELEPGWLPASGAFVFSSTPDRPTDLMVIEIKFGLNALPAAAFKFSDVYDGDRHATDLDFSKVSTASGAIRCTWPNPTVGRASGVRVVW